MKLADLEESRNKVLTHLSGSWDSANKQGLTTLCDALLPLISCARTADSQETLEMLALQGVTYINISLERGGVSYGLSKDLPF